MLLELNWSHPGRVSRPLACLGQARLTRTQGHPATTKVDTESMWYRVVLFVKKEEWEWVRCAAPAHATSFKAIPAEEVHPILYRPISFLLGGLFSASRRMVMNSPTARVCIIGSLQSVVGYRVMYAMLCEL